MNNNNNAAPAVQMPIGYEKLSEKMPFQSVKVDELFTQLAVCNSKIGNSRKSKSGYGYNYADINQVLNMIKKPLAESDLCLTQMVHCIDNVDYLLTQVSYKDQWIRSYYRLDRIDMKQANAAQAKGSALTYARRYSLTALFNIGAEDDDGQSVGQNQQQATMQNANQQVNNNGNQPRSSGITRSVGRGKPATEKQIGMLDALLKEKFSSNAQAYAEQCGKSAPSDWTSAEMSKLIDSLQNPENF